MSMKAIVMFLLVLAFPLEIHSQTTSVSSAPNKLIVPSDNFSAIQELLDDQAKRGYLVSAVSYHSSFKNLHTKGQLEIDFEAAGAQAKRQYCVVTTKLEATELARDLNERAAQGFRLVNPTPIPLELGFVRPRDMFIAIMEKPTESGAQYVYRVVAYRHVLLVRDVIRQALADGFNEICRHQFGPVIYVVWEKVAN